MCNITLLNRPSIFGRKSSIKNVYEEAEETSDTMRPALNGATRYCVFFFCFSDLYTADFAPYATLRLRSQYGLSLLVLSYVRNMARPWGSAATRSIE